jgi:predicted phage terminase large subunit-like protein
MSVYDPRVVDAILRSDFSMFLMRCMATLNPGVPFLMNWHIAAIAYQLERVRRGEITRLIINLPPRYLKSIMASVAFPAFVLGHTPRRRIITVSYAAELADKHSADFRAVVESDWYSRVFPSMRISRNVANELITTWRGFRKSTSILGPLTGFGGDLFIIDDPQKPVDAQSEASRTQLNQWFTNTLISRLDNKETGAIVVVQQRVHMHDLTGYLLETPDGWTVLSLPAIPEIDEQIAIGDGQFYHRIAGEALHPERESLETLQRLRQQMGADLFNAQYQQAPVPPGGAMIKREWLRYYDNPPERSYRSKIIQSWDTAAKDGAQNDWSVCTTWLLHDKSYYLLDLVRGRFDYPTLRRVALALAERFNPHTILIEDASTGIALAQELSAIQHRVVKPVPVERDKQGRLFVEQQKFEAGLVHFPRGAAFLPMLEAELLTFPQSKTDDVVDSISQALHHQLSTYTLDYVR